MVHLSALAPAVQIPWTESARRVRYLDFSSDGTLIALTGVDGATWIEQLSPQWIPRMICAHQSDSLSAYFSRNDAVLISSDATGRVVQHDIASLFPR